MDEARVVINLKEGVVELQGPVEFVRHYLNRYQSAIKGLQGLPPDTGKGPGKEMALPRRKRRGPGRKRLKRQRASSERTLRSYLEAGFFDEPRAPREIRQRLSEAGLAFSGNMVRTNLKRLCETGLLGRTGKGRGVHYSRPGQS